MSEFELSDFSSMTDARISPRSEDTPLCWHCKEGTQFYFYETIRV